MRQGRLAKSCGRGTVAAMSMDPSDYGFRRQIPAALAALINPSDPADPIARQFLPDPKEAIRRADEQDDPIGDGVHTAVRGLVHRYPDRALVKITQSCAVHCRFCFRRSLLEDPNDAMAPEDLDAAVAYVAATPGIREVILSGGDPLTLGPARLGDALRRFAAPPHIAGVRLHTRFPLAAPERIDAALRAALRIDKPLALTVHCNHPRELTPAVRTALAALRQDGVILLAQSVLLAGVNDDAETLTTLWRDLAWCGARPVYLHHLDRAPGVGHFRVPLARGLRLVRSLRGALSGWALPLYVLDVPGGGGKIPVDHLTPDPEAPDLWRGVDLFGRAFHYHDRM